MSQGVRDLHDHKAPSANLVPTAGCAPSLKDLTLKPLGRDGGLESVVLL